MYEVDEEDSASDITELTMTFKEKKSFLNVVLISFWWILESNCSFRDHFPSLLALFRPQFFIKRQRFCNQVL